MNWADERAAFELRVRDNFNTVPVGYPGLPFDPPAAGGWVKMRLLPGDARRITLGPNPVYRERGVLVLMIFTPINEGSNQALTLADELTSLFNEAQFEYSDSGLITCRVPNVDHVGPTQDGNWYQVNLVTDYQRDVVLS